jgi:hypothetical protein
MLNFSMISIIIEPEDRSPDVAVVVSSAQRHETYDHQKCARIRPKFLPVPPKTAVFWMFSTIFLGLFPFPVNLRPNFAYVTRVVLTENGYNGCC